LSALFEHFVSNNLLTFVRLPVLANSEDAKRWKIQDVKEAEEKRQRPRNYFRLKTKSFIN